MTFNSNESEKVSVCALVVKLIDSATSYSKVYEYKVPGEGAELAYAAGFISTTYKNLGKKVASRKVDNCKSIMYISGFSTASSVSFDEQKLYEQIKSEIETFKAEAKNAAIAQAQLRAAQRLERQPRTK